MAIIHFAYTFSLQRFHQDLEAAIMKDDRLQLDRLRQRATIAANNPSRVVRNVLEALRFDPEWWLDYSDDEAAPSSQWYLLALTQYLHSAPSLSSLYPFGPGVIRSVLTDIGWEPVTIEHLIRGRPLSSLIEDSANLQFIKEFTNVDQHGGWLDLDTIRTLLSQFRSAKSSFLAKESRDIEQERILAATHALGPEDIREAAYASGLAMLETADHRQESLFLILD